MPSTDNEFKRVEMFVYLCDVPDDLGAPSFVPLAATADLPALPNWYPPHEAPADDSGWTSPQAHADLYEHERRGAGNIGTVVAYTTSTFHRGRQLTQPRGARFTIHVNYRPAHVEWAARRSWVEEAIKPGWVEFLSRATPEQLALFAIPLPGHPLLDTEDAQRNRPALPEPRRNPVAKRTACGRVDRHLEHLSSIVGPQPTTADNVRPPTENHPCRITSG